MPRGNMAPSSWSIWRTMIGPCISKKITAGTHMPCGITRLGHVSELHRAPWQTLEYSTQTDLRSDLKLETRSGIKPPRHVASSSWTFLGQSVYAIWPNRSTVLFLSPGKIMSVPLIFSPFDTRVPRIITGVPS